MSMFQKKYAVAVIITALASCTASITPNTGTTQPSPTASTVPASPNASASPTPTVSVNSGVAAFDTVLTGNLNAYRGQVGKELVVKTTGSLQGRVWGSDIYTDDSDIGAASVHAGLLKPGQEGIVRLEVLDGQSSYVSTTQNGVSSIAYGPWSGSFRFVEATPTTNASASQVIYSNPGSVVSFRKLTGQQFHFEVKASKAGSVWGTDVYTDDSSLAAAALHAGLLKEGEVGVVTVEIKPGQTSYASSDRNGVTTRDYGNWGGSFSFVGPARYVNNTASLTLVNGTP